MPINEEAREQRNSKLIRVLELMLELAQRRGRTLRELAELFDVHERTIRRDIDALRNAGIDIEQQDDRLRIPVRAAFHPGLQMNADEAFLLLLSLSLARHGVLPRDQNALDAVWRKVSVLLPGKALELADRLGNLYLPLNQPTPMLPHEEQELRFLEDAIVSVTWVRFDYTRRDGGRTTYVAAPHGLLTCYGRVYLLAHVREHVERDPIFFAVNRIREVELLEEPDEVGVTFPGPVDVPAVAQRSFGLWQDDPVEVEILFSGSAVASVLHTRFHPSQEVEQLEDGRARVTLRAAGVQEILWWVLGFGEKAEVIRPASLRQDAKEALRLALARYDRD